MKLLLSKDISLPPDTVTQAIAILAKRRVGKSYTMRRLVEQLFKASQQVVIVDPKGDQWGIRSSADGKKPGLPVLILGGEHGDLPLEASAGETIANLVVKDRVSVLLDISLFRKHEVATFMTAFMENLYRLKAQEQYRTPLMLVIDEADAIAPQKPQANEARMLGAAEDIVRRGGQRGIGCTLVTQRSAVLNKNVLTQCELLIVLRTIAPQDLSAMKAWIDVHGSIEEGKVLMESLPSLPIGDAWFWSPGWPTSAGIFTRTHVYPIETFDSGATPKPGEKKIVPKNLADVDLGALKEAMAATIETAKQNDPKLLRAEVARLTRELAMQKPAPASEVPMGVSQWRDYGKKFGYWSFFETQINQAAGKEWEKIVKAWRDYAHGAVSQLKAFADKIDARPAPVMIPPGWLTPSNIEVVRMPLAPEVKREVKRGELMFSTPTGVRPTSDIQPLYSEVVLKAGARKMLSTIVARHPMRMTKSQFATLCGMSARSSTFDQYLAVLRRAGYIDVREGIYTATDAGIAECGETAPSPQSPAEIRDMWRRNLKAGAAKILDVILAAGEQGIVRDFLAQQVGMSMNSSTFDQYLAILKRNGLIEYTDSLYRPSSIFS